MKRIISTTLAVLMLALLILSTVSCGMESTTGYTRLRDHLTETIGENKAQKLDGSSVNLNSATVSVVTPEGGDREVRACAYAIAQSYVLQITLIMNGSTEKATLIYQVLSSSDASEISRAHSTILLTHYTGNDTVAFESMEGISPINELTNRQNATALLNSLLYALDVYTTSELDMNLTELGFIALSDKYMADVENAIVEEDLGGMLSPARWAYALRMLVQGLGMVFLVLAMLWIVLLIFKKAFYKDPAKAQAQVKNNAAPAPADIHVEEVAPVADDGALIAVITAAVAAAIESDPATASQFAGGFRVVSFKKTETTTRNRR